MKKVLLTSLLVIQCLCMSGQKITFIIMPNAKNNLPGGPDGKNYAAIVKTNESKKNIVTKSLTFMKKYGFVPETTKINAIDSKSSEVSYDVEIPLTRFYQEMLEYDANKLFCKLRFEFHESNVMIVFQNITNEILGICTTRNDKNSQAYTEYLAEGAALTYQKTLIGKFLVHANLGPEERKDFYKKLNDYFSDIASKCKTYETLVKNGEAKWFTTEGVKKQYTDYPVPAAKGVLRFLSKPETKDVLIGVSQKRWDKQVKEVFDNLFRAFCLELKGEIDGIAEDGEQTWEIVDGKLVPSDPKLQKSYISKGKTYYDE